MTAFKYGDPILYEQIKEELQFETTDENVIRKEMSQRAMDAINTPINGEGARNTAILRANGMKDSFGNGICTRVLIYNASGGALNFNSEQNLAGRWKNKPTNRIEVGEWCVGFHVKTSGTATGSGSITGFNVEGFDNVFVLGWSTPFSGANHGSCYTMTKQGYMNTPWSTLINWAETDPDTKVDVEGSLRVWYSINQESSPTMEVIITHKDVNNNR